MGKDFTVSYSKTPHRETPKCSEENIHFWAKIFTRGLLETYILCMEYRSDFYVARTSISRLFRQNMLLKFESYFLLNYIIRILALSFAWYA